MIIMSANVRIGNDRANDVERAESQEMLVYRWNDLALPSSQRLDVTVPRTCVKYGLL